ncbi:MAG: hypothetical protein ACK4NR_06565 [Micavibrio sp.]
MASSLKNDFPSLEDFHRQALMGIVHQLVASIGNYASEAEGPFEGDQSRKLFALEFPGHALIDQSSEEEKDGLKQALKKLHDICQKKNMGVDVMGFESVPTLAVVTREGLMARPAPTTAKKTIAISLDLNGPYNFLCNPYDDAAVKKELKNAARKPAPAAMTAAGTQP